MQANLYIDGGSRGNPGPAGCGFVVKSPDGKILKEGCAYLRRCTNNVAEYTGLIRGLELAQSMGITEVNIFSDSELLVRQITGEYRVKSPDLKPMHERAERTLIRFGRWQIKHVRREFNADADRMANRAMDLGEAGKMAPDDLNAPRQQHQLDFAAAPADEPKRTASSASAASKPARAAVPAIDSAAKSKTKTAAATTAKKSSAAPLIDADDAADTPTTSPASATTVKILAEVTAACGCSCPATMVKGQCFVFSDITPPGLCLNAMESLLPAVLAIQRQQHTARTVACNRPGCSATFKLSALRPLRNLDARGPQ